MTGKRANGEGTISQRKTGRLAGMWEGALTTPEGRKHVYAKSQQECREKLKTLINNWTTSFPPSQTPDPRPIPRPVA